MLKIGGVIFGCGTMATSSYLNDGEREANPILNSKNWQVWVQRSEAAIIDKGCWEAINPGYRRGALSDVNAKVNSKARAYIIKHIGDEFLADIADIPRAKDCWERLKEVNGTYSSVHVATMLKELALFEKTDSMSIHQYAATIQDYGRKLESGGLQLPATTNAGGNDAYEPSEGVCYVGRKQVTAGLSISTLKSELAVEEARISTTSSSPVKREQDEATANTARKSQSWKGDRNHRGGSHGGAEGGYHRGGRSRGHGSRGGGASRQPSDGENRPLRCYSCGVWDHVSRDCSEAKTHLESKGA